MLLALLEALLKRVGDPDLFLFSSLARIRAVVKDALDFLVGKDAPFRLSSLQGGGATFHYLTLKNRMDLQRRGRWASLKSWDH